MAVQNGLIGLARIFIAFILIKWMIKLAIFFILLIFALIATPICLIAKSTFNPWSIVLFPFIGRSRY